MYLFTPTNPNRDGALENDVPVYEKHPNRMDGTGAWTEKTSAAVPDDVMGQYIINSPAGIRTHPYSTSSTVNPPHLRQRQHAHQDIGEVWAKLLHNVYTALVGQWGWSPDLRTNPDGTEGNIVYMHLFIYSLPLQPCSPTFLTVCNAWLQADINRYNGTTAASYGRRSRARGSVVNAANHINNADIPSDC
ncbi:Fungalysin metallopeptidase-domain-containing protein [Mycena olivaceomarginata]|nr:Fungalysin metallopeptidase-domain-containing protein [Mycena olivaceomarginata]